MSPRSEGSNEWMFSKDIDFHLVKSELPNIYTAGGRHIYIYDGLFQQSRNEDELASLFCHEYAHVYGRHAQKELKRCADQVRASVQRNVFLVAATPASPPLARKEGVAATQP